MEIVMTVLGYLAPFIGSIADKVGVVGMIIAYLLLFVVPVVSILIEVAEGIAAFTETKSDDEAVAKIKSGWAKVVPILELLPHVNLPLAPAVTKILFYAKKFAKAVAGALKGWAE